MDDNLSFLKGAIFLVGLGVFVLIIGRKKTRPGAADPYATFWGGVFNIGNRTAEVFTGLVFLAILTYVLYG